MANFNYGQPTCVNEGKVEDRNPVEQYPPYHGWPQQHPGYIPHPWYPPYHQQQSPALTQKIDSEIKQEIDFSLDQEGDVTNKQEIDSSTKQESDSDIKQEVDSAIKQDINQPPDIKQEASPTEDFFKQEHPYFQYHPQQGPPHYQYPYPHAQYLPVPQSGDLHYPSFYPPPPYNPMPAWNQNGQYYNHGWEQFQQHQQNSQNLRYIDGNKAFPDLINGDNSMDASHYVTNELDSSSERTSDLGSSLNDSSSGESTERATVPIMLTSSRKYSEWEEDELTLLPGWKKRSYYQGTVKKKIFYQYISPSLEIFETRGKVVEHLKLTGHSEEDIYKVKLGSRRFRSAKDPRLLYNDWADDESLPTGWKKRFYEWDRGTERKAKKYTYLSPNNSMFSSRSDVVLFMRKSDEYSEDDVQKVLSGSRSGVRDPNHIKVEAGFPHSRKTQDIRLRYNDWADDESLPIGWKSRFIEWKRGTGYKKAKKYTYLAPDNRTFNSRVEIVLFMRNSNEFSEDDVQKVLSGSRSGKRDPNHINIVSDWISDDTLPSGWKKRSKDWKNGNRMSKKHSYLSPDNRIFNSRTEIVLFMRNSEEYSEDDVQKVISGSLQGKAHRSHYVQKVLSDNSGDIRDPDHVSTNIEWISDETLPSGWKKRFRIWRNGGRMSKKYTYSAPDNRIFNSRTEIISFMRNSEEYSEDDVQKAISGSLQGKAPRVVHKNDIY